MEIKHFLNLKCIKFIKKQVGENKKANMLNVLILLGGSVGQGERHGRRRTGKSTGPEQAGFQL